MKKTFTRVLTLALALLMLAGVAACAKPDSGNEGEVTTTAAAAAETTLEPVETKLTANLPDVKYDCDFIIASGFATDTKYTCMDIVEAELDGDLIKDSLYRRTILMEDKFGIHIDVQDVAYAKINNSVTAGGHDYDVGTATLSEIMNVVNNGSCIDLMNVPTIDLSMPWWDQNAQDKLRIGNTLYYTLSDFIICGLDNARAVYFNKELAADTNAGNLYELVEKNEWTIDKMKELSLAALSDLDGVAGYTTADRMGIVNNATTFYEVMLTGCDAEIMKQGDNGIPYFCTYDEKDFFLEVYTKLLDLFSKDEHYLICTTDESRSMFMNGQSMFTADTLYYASKMRAEAGIEFGIMPVPKYSAEQEKYLHVSPNPDAFFIIQGDDKTTERTGVLLEALSFYSSSYYSDDALIPCYFDLALTSKSAPDVDSSQNLQIVHDNISYVIKIIGTDFSNAIYGQFSAANYNLTSILKAQESIVNKKLDKVLTDLNIEH